MNNTKVLIGIVLLITIFIVGIIFLNNKNVIKQLQTQEKPGGSVTPSTTQVRKETIIDVTSNGFSPNSVTIKAGSRVVWINKTDGKATVNSDVYPTNQVYPPLNLGEFGKKSSVQLVFNKPGTYGYHNHFKPEQKGVVVVE